MSRVVDDELHPVPGRVADERGPRPGGLEPERGGELRVPGRAQPRVGRVERGPVRGAVGDVGEIGVAALDQLDLGAVDAGEHRDPGAGHDVRAAAEDTVPEQGHVAPDRGLEIGHGERHVVQYERHPARFSS